LSIILNKFLTWSQNFLQGMWYICQRLPDNTNIYIKKTIDTQLYLNDFAELVKSGLAVSAIPLRQMLYSFVHIVSTTGSWGSTSWQIVCLLLKDKWCFIFRWRWKIPNYEKKSNFCHVSLKEIQNTYTIFMNYTIILSRPCSLILMRRASSAGLFSCNCW